MNRRKFPSVFSGILLSFVFFFFVSSSGAFATMGRKAMVVTADTHATQAAFAVLQQGGNAADAAIAAQWVLNVVEPQSSGIGGGGFFLYYEAATKRIFFFDGREKAPSTATPTMFLDKDGKPLKFYPDAITGGLAVGVPGTLKLLEEVHGQFGSKQFAFRELFNPAIYLAEQGFPVSERLSHHIQKERKRLKKFPASKKIFLTPSGKALKPGTVLKQPDLAKTFRLIQQQGTGVFYEGEIAEAIRNAVKKSPYRPGEIKKEDLAFYSIVRRDPLYGQYRGYDIFSAPPPSSGGVALIETLNILEQFPPAGRDADGIHLFAEAQKLAFRDRNAALGDPDFVKIPVEKLISKDFAKARALNIHSKAASPSTLAAVRPLHLENTHTSHISVVDEQGNMAAFTTTIEYVFGCGMVVPGYGFVLNNELTDFDMTPYNEKGELVPNAPAADKRPRSSMTPTFVFKEGKPVMIVGSPGGSRIIGTVLNVVTNVLDIRQSLEDAMGASRLINRDGPIEMEQELFENKSLRRELERRGHPIEKADVLGNVQAIHFDEETDFIYGIPDPRGEGEAKGY